MLDGVDPYLALTVVKVKVGRDSYEYAMAGSVRFLERKRPKRKAKQEVALLKIQLERLG
jgi:hypothetical protein